MNQSAPLTHFHDISHLVPPSEDPVSITDPLSTLASALSGRSINWRVHVEDNMKDAPDAKTADHYVRNSGDTARLVLAAMSLAGKTSVSSILDFACGFGLASRQFVALFPQADLTCCDLREDQVHFCAQEFGARPVLSVDDFNEVDFGRTFDLIWVGSLFTHLPRHKFNDCLKLLSRSLAPDGLAIFTTHGRFSSVYGRENYCTSARFDVLLEQFLSCGFGYVDYSDEPSPKTNNYGLTLSSTAFVADAIAPDSTVKVVAMMERGWSGHQDVWALQKTPVLV